MTRPPLHPIQAEFMQLYPPHVYSMAVDAQAKAWADFQMYKKQQAQHADSRDTMQAWRIGLFVLVPWSSGSSGSSCSH